MRELRATLRDLIPTPVRERYHRYALLRDFGIDSDTGSRRPTLVDARIRPGLNVIGYFESPSGVGQSARSLAGAAEAAGIPVRRIEASERGKKEQFEGAYAVNLFHVNADAAASVVEQLGPRLHAGRANIGYWYWESTEFPRFWRNRFAYFDEIWVASEFCRKAIAAASPIPVELVPPAIEVCEGPSDARTRAGVATRDFMYLTVLDAMSGVERKNPVGTVKAFARALPLHQSSDALLHVQISNAESVPGLLPALRKASLEARVEIGGAVISRADVETLLRACDAYVSLHRAEGFGFPLAEAMALGKPVIATDYSGSADFLDASTGFPVNWKPLTLVQPVRDYGVNTQWADPDEENAVAQIRRVYEDREEARRRGAAARRRIADRYDSKIVGRQMASQLGRLTERLKKTA